MLTLTSAVVIPNIQKIRLKAPAFDDDAGVATFAGEAQLTGGLVYATLGLTIRNGSCQGIRATVSPVGATDRLETFTVSVATGYTDCAAAYNGQSGSIGAKLKAVETWAVGVGLLPAGSVA